MPKKSLNIRIILTLLVLAACIFSIKNPEKDLRLGRDLRGGASLIYQVLLKPEDNPAQVVPLMIDVLKKRVDPNGIAEIQIVQQGADRIEVTMPLPNQKTKDLKAAYEASLAKLDDARIDEAAFERLMRLSGEERAQAITAQAAGSTTRAALLTKAAEANDRDRAARDAFEKASAAQADQATLNDLLSKAGEAADAYDAARSAALAATLSATEVRRALELSDQTRTILDEKGKGVQIDSPRQTAIKRLRETHPEAAQEFDAVLAAFDAYAVERRTLEDPADLKRLLRGAGVLDFRITVNPGGHPEENRLRQELQERGPRNVRTTDARWYRINRIDTWYNSVPARMALEQDPVGFFRSRNYIVEQYRGDGDYYILCWDTRANRLTQAEGRWAIDRAAEGHDELGKPSITFQMNPSGATLLGELTGTNVGQHMAILLDDQVYTAPTLNSRITSNGQIVGDFEAEERNYVIRTLGAGSLAAKLSPEPISESTLGPELGFDNLRKGLIAGLAALAVISAFMLVYYFPTCGTVAIGSLIANAVMILGLMSINRAAFTMPGIAGVILTFGQAVDSNVLVYERMREELHRGHDLRTAVRLGFSRAFASIVDGNIANLLVCAVLYYMGTQEIRGFAVTMVIGVLTTLFAALVINRVVFSLLVDHGPLRKVSMLPIAVPAVARALELKVDWIRLRWIFWSISLVMMGIGLAVCVMKGGDLLDNDFRGGTQITVPLKEESPGQRMVRTRKDIQELVEGIGNAAPEGSQLQFLRTADVLPVNPRQDNVSSDTFTIKTLATDKDAVVEALITKFKDAGLIELLPPLTFAGLDASDLRNSPTYRIITDNLGDNIQRPQYRDNVRDYIGGVAIVLANIQPTEPLRDLTARLDQMRTQPDFADTQARGHTVRVLEGTEEDVKTAVILVRDPVISFFDNEQGWESEVRAREWSLINEALAKSSTPASVQNFSPSIASTFKAQAIVATLLSFLLLGIYIWVRFGTINYAMAAVIPLAHDVLILIALIALAETIYDTPATQPIAAALGILPFKIDLNMVAAMLTIVGYSLNDTIIIMDRIRENRGKLAHATKKIINDSVNQTFSRTIITSGTTLFSTVMLYLYGGESMRGFAYVLTLGVFVGTYSSVAITAPIVWSRRLDPETESPRSPMGTSAINPA